MVQQSIKPPITLYHGSRVAVEAPDLLHGREDIDFGRGFYTTPDEEMAKKWASGKTQAHVSIYTLKDYDHLRIQELGLDEQWLSYVAKNRRFLDIPWDENGVDVITGPTADDKLFNTLNTFFKGGYSLEQTLRYLNIMNYSKQVVFKTARALECLHFEQSFRLTPQAQMEYQTLVRRERQAMNKNLSKLQRQDSASILPILLERNTFTFSDNDREDEYDDER